MRYILGSLRWAINLIFACLLLGLALTMLAPLWTDLGFRSVVSGSMEPSIPLGSVAMVEPVDITTVQPRDIISFNSPEDPTIVVTHRVIEVSGPPEARVFRTKGDANDDADLVPIPAEKVLGQVRFHLPYLGYLARYIRTRQGWIYLVLVPGGMLIFIELIHILKVIWTSDKKPAAESEATEELV